MTTHTTLNRPSAACAAGPSFAPSESPWPALASRLRSWSQPLRQALLVGSAALLVACGGGGGGGAAVPPDGGVITPPDVAAPGAPATPAGLSLGAAGIKTLNFQWTAVTGATHYQLLEDLDGTGTASSPTAVSTSIAATQYGHEVPLYERLNATYTLRACNALGCSASSAAFQPSLADLNAAIGYAKATGGGVAGDYYGAAIALSRDGNTLAVGAPEEEQGAIVAAGAVYVMRRSAAGVWTAPQRLLDETPAQSENFGTSLALSANGSVLAVGAPNAYSAGTAIGMVSMFVFNTGTQAYDLRDSVTSPNADPDDQFGLSVALSDDGNALAVGAPQEDSALGAGGAFNPGDNSASNAGAVYVYAYDGVGEWAPQQSIKASNAGSQDRFGASIAISGDGLTLAVGAFLEDSSSALINPDPLNLALAFDDAVNAGAVYVFNRATVNAIFGNQVYVKASNTDAGDLFGTSVALSQNGSVLAVGAFGESSAATGVGGNEADDTMIDAGAVYVFVRSDATGAWSQQAYIKASNTSVGAQFGSAVALSSDGTTLAVGAVSDSRTSLGLGAETSAPPSANARGAVYVFRRDATGAWAQSAYVKPPTALGVGTHQFGSAVALSGAGNSLAVGNSREDHEAPDVQYPTAGAPGFDNALAADSGAVYIF